MHSCQWYQLQQLQIRHMRNVEWEQSRLGPMYSSCACIVFVLGKAVRSACQCHSGDRTRLFVLVWNVTDGLYEALPLLMTQKWDGVSRTSPDHMSEI